MRARLTPGSEARSGLELLVAMVGAMWLVEAINSVDHDALDKAGGIYPRNVDRLWGIFTSPFLHENFYPHLFDNTIPLLFMGAFIAWRGARRLALVSLIVIVVAGIGAWLISPSGEYIIGASGLVFGYATYLFARGLFNRNVLEIAIGLIVGALWGVTLVASVIPQAHISWQDHVCGAVGGVVAAWLLASPRSRARGAGSRGGGSPTGGSRGDGRAGTSPAPLGGSELHSALDRALEH